MAEENLTNINTGDSQLDQKIQEWMALDKHPKTLEEVRNLIKEKNFDELKVRMLSNLSFGTAGLRSSMGAGFSKFNDLTVIQATQGIAKYILKTFSDAKERGVVIGFDARHNSERLSQRAAAVFLSQGIKVYLFNKITPTPFVPFGVTYYRAACGVMITASHNPKDDNGYKVYNENGAQLTSPYDKAVSQCIKENSIPWDESWDLELSKYKELLINPYDEVFAAYFEALKKYSHFGNLNEQTKITFTFTPMHGVGQIFAVKAFEVFKLPPFVSVIEQMNPDPDFPTVKYPNPEEGKSALDLAMKAADANGSTVIIANDPDSDRTAIAEKQSNGKWKVLTGNETGALLGWWAFFCHKKDHPQLYPGDNVYMIASTVSSKFLDSMAKVEGFKFDETLTGFKWMGNQAHSRMQQGKTVLFAYEEAIGFMYGTNVLDKDGVSAGVVLAEMATYLNTQGLTLTQQLSKLYESYGVHISINSYYLCMSPPVITNIFNRIRTLENGQYPLSCGGFKISGIRDLTTGYDSTKPDNKAVLPTSKSSQMITFYFENGCVATLRTSGTEPKIKYYTEITGRPGEKVDMEAATSTLQKLVNSIVIEFLQPEVNDLIAKSD
ncbi:glucose 1,6-bisphosphate synthase-like [Actinia tenebrosa]|uniref:Glucose 1,6-bisphosphate synthase-like n=1 Tax=Actinia tenebrosa TaxID=6105 RepID=A0A6P8J1Q0_ACTTE|nr:glucose 1,6-bisphosphate synthase-like [Actinia tenebrosa]